MQPRRLRPVAALTLALVAAPFLAATAVARTNPVRPEVPVVAAPTRTAAVRHARWLAAATASVQKTVELVASASAANVVPPAPAPAPALAPVVRTSRSVRGIAASRTVVGQSTTWIWPGNGPITSPFGRRWGRMHQGVDIDAAFGSPVVAPQAGTVTAAGWGQTGYGLVVEISHGNGISTLYAHLSSISVVPGQVVAQGERLGAVGKTGASTGAHLHYEVHLGGVPQNPMAWLVRGGASSTGHPG